MDKTPSYNLKAVCHETGLTPATLRAWERRYGVLHPRRSTGGHRLYSEAEINMLNWLVARQKEGLSISLAVEMWRSQPEQIPHPAEEQGTARELSTSLPSTNMIDELLQAWYSACLDFNEAKAEQAIAKALAIASPEVVCTQLLQKGLAQLGEGWYTGKVSIQQEHFASALVARRLNTLFAVSYLPRHPGRLLAVCPPGEQHDLGLLMMAFILRWQGWEVIYLGANVSLVDLGAAVQSIEPRIVLSAAQTLESAAALRELAETLRTRGIPLAYGGGVFSRIPRLVQYIPAVFLGNSLEDVSQKIEKLLSGRTASPSLQLLPGEYAAALMSYQEKEAGILNFVKKILQCSAIDPHHVDIANQHFSGAIVSALTLGEIGLLDYPARWINGFLSNYGLPPAQALEYYRAFEWVLREQCGQQAAPILDWFIHLEDAGFLVFDHGEFSEKL